MTIPKPDVMYRIFQKKRFCKENFATPFRFSDHLLPCHLQFLFMQKIGFVHERGDISEATTRTSYQTPIFLFLRILFHQNALQTKQNSRSEVPFRPRRIFTTKPWKFHCVLLMSPEKVESCSPEHHKQACSQTSWGIRSEPSQGIGYTIS